MRCAALSRAEVEQILEEVLTAASKQARVAQLCGEVEAMSEELLQAREVEIKMNAEMQLLKLRGSGIKSLTKAEAQVAKQGELIVDIKAKHAALSTELLELGVSNEELANTAGGGIRQRQLRVFVEGRMLSQFQALTPLTTARDNLFHTKLEDDPCIVRKLHVTSTEQRRSLEKASSIAPAPKSHSQQRLDGSEVARAAQGCMQAGFGEMASGRRGQSSHRSAQVALWGLGGPRLHEAPEIPDKGPEGVVAVQQLEHVFLAPLDAVFYEDDYAYLQYPCKTTAAEELVTVQQWLAEKPRRAYEIGELFSQLAGILAYLHRHGVIVQTLALNNVLVVNDRSPLLVDIELPFPSDMPTRKAAMPEPHSPQAPPGDSFMALSFSAMHGTQTPETSPAGGRGASTAQPAEEAGRAPGPVPGYIAPEVESGGEVSAGADLWALGVMLFEANFSTLTPVPDGEKGGVPIPSHDDESLRHLLSLLLRTDPALRLQTADEVLAHPYLATDMLGRDPGGTHQIVQTEWKVKLVHEYGHRIQAGRQPVPATISMDDMLNSVMSVALLLKDSALMHPLHITFVNAPQNAPSPTISFLYQSFFSEVLHPRAMLFETRADASAASNGSPGLGSMLPSCTVLRLDALEATGRFLVKCVIDGCIIPALLAPSCYKFLLGSEPSLADLEPYDPGLAAILRTLLDATTQAQLQQVCRIHQSPAPTPCCE
ncbi:hypothetical protein CYMTET_26247 [Cymbomonas tetramitiformis]|uniref:non-specific serine/threonine protein kinase n=1 Tax=Cymbomonas tetramitiformis TaxID=36881 RepID=A0AAE0FSG8_9CHLO|nr:hypothetical protein CYMTET_26247 [Cymbomonas tetramitiformis]